MCQESGELVSIEVDMWGGMAGLDTAITVLVSFA